MSRLNLLFGSYKEPIIQIIRLMSIFTVGPSLSGSINVLEASVARKSRASLAQSAVRRI